MTVLLGSLWRLLWRWIQHQLEDLLGGDFFLDSLVVVVVAAENVVALTFSFVTASNWHGFDWKRRID